MPMEARTISVSFWLTEIRGERLASGMTTGHLLPTTIFTPTLPDQEFRRQATPPSPSGTGLG